MRNSEIVEKMIECIEKIDQYCAGLTKEDFVSRQMVADATALNVEIIGEYANKLDDFFKEAYPDIPWIQIYGMRNKIAHDYDGINLDILWDTVQTDLPQLKEVLQQCANGK